MRAPLAGRPPLVARCSCSGLSSSCQQANDSSSSVAVVVSLPHCLLAFDRLAVSTSSSTSAHAHPTVPPPALCRGMPVVWRLLSSSHRLVSPGASISARGDKRNAITRAESGDWRGSGMRGEDWRCGEGRSADRAALIDDVRRR
uniref:Uncharacterized protein n=1 Tax=Plectus sambesii TaxID=2011161 RepID=A0A914XJ27_9BILA